MTATEVLRRMLDERGVEWSNMRNDGSESNYFTEWYFDGINGRATATEWSAGNNLSVVIHRWGLTPEQAIAATLERETCRDEGCGRLAFKCSECGCWSAYDDDWSTYIYAWRGDVMRSIFPRYCPNCGRKVVLHSS